MALVIAAHATRSGGLFGSLELLEPGRSLALTALANTLICAAGRGRGRG
ncbi:MAG: hypothetical protein WAN93_00660 [Solirubrobacteraceae bacterium]